MNRRKNILRVLSATVICITVMMTVLFVLNRITYSSLEENLEEKLLASDTQSAYALEKQMAVFSTSMKGYATSIKQASTKGVEKNKNKLKILLSDLSIQLRASSMGICDKKGKGIIGPDVDVKALDSVKRAFVDGEEAIEYTKKGPLGERDCIMFAVPIFDDKSNKDYVFYASIARSIISEIFNAATSYEQQYMMLVDKSNNIVIPMDDKIVQAEVMNKLHEVMKDEHNSYNKKFAKNIKKDGTSIGNFELDNGERVHISIIELKDLPWYLVTSVAAKESDVYIEEATNSLRILFTVMMVIIVSIIVMLQIMQYKKQEDMFKMAYYDSMTNLYNGEYIHELIVTKKKVYDKLSFILFDIKGLKYINELYGYAEGDRIVRAMAKFLRDHGYKEDKFHMYGRLEDDSFAMVVESDIDDELVKWVKNYVINLKEYLSEEYDVNVWASIAPVEANEEENYKGTVGNAFTAMELIKGKNGFQIGIYNQELKEEQVRQKRLENDLPEAIKNKEFIIYYQPKYDAKTERLVGAEALVRWQHPEFGFMGPGLFIPVFENDGLIGKVDMYVLEEVCCKLKEWKEKGLYLPPISVNLSRAEIIDRNLVKTIKNVRSKYDIDAELIEIEITESSLSANENKLIDISKQLQKAGFSLAIDDFGTGYSSLSQLIKMPVNTIKLDKSFLDTYAKDGNGSNAHVFICDVIQIAKHINCYVVAEGVETKEQRDMLAAAGCDIIQGYYYGKPMPEPEFRKLLEEYDALNENLVQELDEKAVIEQVVADVDKGVKLEPAVEIEIETGATGAVHQITYSEDPPNENKEVTIKMYRKEDIEELEGANVKEQIKAKATSVKAKTSATKEKKSSARVKATSTKATNSKTKTAEKKEKVSSTKSKVVGTKVKATGTKTKTTGVKRKTDSTKNMGTKTTSTKTKATGAKTTRTKNTSAPKNKK